MAAPVPLETLLAARTLWHAGRSAALAPDGEATGFDALDALLPQRGWPRRALSELLLPADGVGEVSLLLPALARLTRAGGAVAVVAPPYVPYAPAWQAGGVDLSRLQVIDASPRDALWAFEQCLRSGACTAVLGWPATGDARALRRLQVAADSGECLGFALRDRRHAANPSPAALRLEAVRDARGGTAWQVRKCRGGPVPRRAFVVPDSMPPASWSSPVLAALGHPLPQAGEGKSLVEEKRGPVGRKERRHGNVEPLSRLREWGRDEGRPACARPAPDSIVLPFAASSMPPGSGSPLLR